MSMVCPQCNGIFDQHLQCPACGVRLNYEATSGRTRKWLNPQDERWQHTALGRVLVGLLLTQGLAYGLRMLFTAGLLVSTEEDGQNVWHTLFGLVLVQGLQGLSLVVGAALAGAGKRHGALLGSAVGLLNGFLLLLIQDYYGEPLTEVAVYGQPILHLAVGTLGGLLGTVIWKPLPVLALARPLGESKVKTVRGLESRRTSLLAGPVSWARVALGIAVVVAGVISPTVVLDFVMEASGGKMSVNTHLQAELVTWEISALAMLLGAGLGGMNTSNGLKQGLCVGVGSAVMLVGFHLGSRHVTLEQTVITVFSVLCMCVVGGWFGGQLFPPLYAPAQRKGLREATLSRLGW